MKAEILLTLLCERLTNIVMYLKDEQLNNYENVKQLELREFKPKPQVCLELLKKSQRLIESHVQFTSTLTTNFQYYKKNAQF